MVTIQVFISVSSCPLILLSIHEQVGCGSLVFLSVPLSASLYIGFHSTTSALLSRSHICARKKLEGAKLLHRPHQPIQGTGLQHTTQQAMQCCPQPPPIPPSLRLDKERPDKSCRQVHHGDIEVESGKSWSAGLAPLVRHLNA